MAILLLLKDSEPKPQLSYSLYFKFFIAIAPTNNQDIQI